jgi:hypothetical protein
MPSTLTLRRQIEEVSRMSAMDLETIIAQVQQLPIDEQEKLLSTLEALLAEKKISSHDKDLPPGLVYGKYRNTPGHMSTEEDFRLAEWHPTDQELDGE